MHVGTYCRERGMGFVPIIAAALSTGAALYTSKAQGSAAKDAEKAAMEQARLAAKAQAAAARQRTRQTRMLVIGGVGVLAIGVLGYALLRRRRGR